MKLHEIKFLLFFIKNLKKKLLKITTFILKNFKKKTA